MHVWKSIVVIALPLASMWTPAVAQSAAVTPADIRSLQDAIFEAGNDIARLRTGDAALRTELSATLDDLRDDVIYLKVKLRKKEIVTRADVRSVRDGIDGVHRRARGPETVTGAGLGPTSPAPPPPAPTRLAIPAGARIDVRLLSSIEARALPGDVVEAATVSNLVSGGQVVIPAGALVRGEVTQPPPGTIDQPVLVRFTQITVNYETHDVDATIERPATRTQRTATVPIGTVVTIRFDTSR